MASLFKRGRKGGGYNWHVAYYVNGKHFTKSTGTSDKRLAQEILKKVEVYVIRQEEGLEPAGKIEPMLLSTFIEIYLEYRQQQGSAERTISTDLYALERLKDYVGDVNLTTITQENVRRYRDCKLKRLKATSVAIEFRHLKAALNWAVEKAGEKFLRQNPFKQRGLIPTPVGRTLPPILAPEEKAQFFSAIDNPDHQRLFKFFLLTACRRSEAINLQWRDIDLGEKQITFRKTKTKIDRVIPINLELLQVVMSLDRKQPKPFPYTGDWVSHLFAKYLRKAKISRPMSLHGLRHTCASDMVRAGIHLTKISKFLGHASITTTQIYTHVLPSDLREVAEVLSAIG